MKRVDFKHYIAAIYGGKITRSNTSEHNCNHVVSVTKAYLIANYIETDRGKGLERESKRRAGRQTDAKDTNLQTPFPEKLWHFLKRN